MANTMANIKGIQTIPQNECVAIAIKNNKGDVTHIITSLILFENGTAEMVYKLYAYCNDVFRFSGKYAPTTDELELFISSKNSVSAQPSQTFSHKAIHGIRTA